MIRIFFFIPKIITHDVGTCDLTQSGAQISLIPVKESLLKKSENRSFSLKVNVEGGKR